MGSHKCSFGNKCVDKARKEAKRRCKDLKLTKEEVKEEIHTSVQHVLRMIIQGRLGVELQSRYHDDLYGTKHVYDVRRLIDASSRKDGRYETRDVYDGRRLVEGSSWSGPKGKRPRMEISANVITLTDLEIFPKVGVKDGKTIVGTLEFIEGRFRYTTSSHSFCFSFSCADVKEAFFRVEDEKMPSLLHFHFRRHIKVGTSQRRDIQFRFVQLVGQKRSYDDSGMINKDLNKFIHDVQEKWRYEYPFTFAGAEVHKANEFQGHCSSEVPTVFGLTCSALVRLVDEPFIVVTLDEVEIVNFRIKPELSKPVEIDMTIVFSTDGKCPPVRINSIPIEKLNLIKDSCNYSGVKYFENELDDIDWPSIVKKVAKSRPGSPVDWSGLENPETLKYYKQHAIYCGPDGIAFCGSGDDEDEDDDVMCRLEN